MATSPSPADFFISYTSTDSQWAQWIAQTLEANGYKTELMDWDFLPGENFVVRMHQAAMAGVRVLAVVSPAYMESAFGTPEWAAAFADDPTGDKRQLIPVLVGKVARRGLLNQLVPINLIGKSEEAAAAELLRKVGSSERLLPEVPVTFPGAAEPAGPGAESSAGLTHEDWAPLDRPMALPAAQPGRRTGSWESSVVLEVHLVPVPARRMPVAVLRALPDDLATAARSARFFTGSQALVTEVQNDTAYVKSQSGRDIATRGLSITRDGTLSIWDGLPQDSMGAVIDVIDVQARIASLVTVAAQLSRIESARVSVGARLTTHGMYIFGTANAVGNRSSASGLKLGDDVFEALPEDTVSTELMQSNPESIGHEMAARLESAWSEARSRFV